MRLHYCLECRLDHGSVSLNLLLMVRLLAMEQLVVEGSMLEVVLEVLV